MAIAQDAFYIPDDIAIGLATGLYRRIGSVVRYAVGPNKGQIVKNLQPIDLKAAEQAQGLGAKAIQFVANHKKEVGIAAIGVAIVWGYTAWKNHEPKVLTEFRAALKVYIETIRTGNMSVEKIDNLMVALEELKKHKNYDKIIIQLITEELEVLVGRIYDYTIKLAEDNAVELSDDELNLDNSAIINLQFYLKAQKRIFEAAALCKKRLTTGTQIQ
ncbi:MAG: hypothetical protein HFH82_00675 [Lachnospiraceae bacterium]|nr:hypothetical protein [Lachnospiraceae bacterium]